MTVDNEKMIERIVEGPRIKTADVLCVVIQKLFENIKNTIRKTENDDIQKKAAEFGICYYCRALKGLSFEEIRDNVNELIDRCNTKFEIYEYVYRLLLPLKEYSDTMLNTEHFEELEWMRHKMHESVVKFFGSEELDTDNDSHIEIAFVNCYISTKELSKILNEKLLKKGYCFGDIQDWCGIYISDIASVPVRRKIIEDAKKELLDIIQDRPDKEYVCSAIKKAIDSRVRPTDKIRVLDAAYYGDGKNKYLKMLPEATNETFYNGLGITCTYEAIHNAYTDCCLHKRSKVKRKTSTGQPKDRAEIYTEIENNISYLKEQRRNIRKQL